MKTTIQLSIIFFLGIFTTAAFSQDKSASLFKEKFKIIEGHQKNLDESYKNKLKEINRQQENIEKTLATELYVVDTRMNRTEWRLNFIMGFFGLSSIAGIIALFVIYMKVRDYAEKKLKKNLINILKKSLKTAFRLKRMILKN